MSADGPREPGKKAAKKMAVPTSAVTMLRR